MNLLGKNKRWWIAGSVISLALGMVALGIWGLKIGIDFKGGTLLEVETSQNINAEEFKQELEAVGVTNIISQTTGEKSLLVKSATIDDETHKKVNALLAEKQYVERRFENVGPTVGRDLTQKAVVAVILASVAIILYIAYSFRNVPQPASSWRFGVTAILALVHDVAIVVGAFAILGHYFGYEVDALFITAILTVMGFSVHDTIVVFDRLRETMLHSPISTPEKFESAANASLVQTLNRSLNTSLTVIIVLLAMAVLGGESVRPFIIALLIGVTVGTYSSIGMATPVLVLWQNVVMRRRARA